MLGLIAAGAASGLAGTTLSNYYNKKSSSRNADISTQASFNLDKAESKLNRRDYEWQKSLDYQYDSNEYYNLARKYSENSSKWQVEGLRNAGLNPILAATDGNFSSTYGTGSSSGSMGHASSSVSAHADTPHTGGIVDVNNALRTAYDTEQTKVNTEIAEGSKQANIDLARAQVRRVNAETANIAANTARSLANIQNEQIRVANDTRRTKDKSYGFRIGNDSFNVGVGGGAIESAVDYVKKMFKNHSNDTSATGKKESSFSSSRSPSPGSAKSSAERDEFEERQSKRKDEKDRYEIKWTSHGVPYRVDKKPTQFHRTSPIHTW